jgi:hypothetical protein
MSVEITITLRRSTENQCFYCGQTDKNFTLIGKITECVGGPKWLRDENVIRTGLISGSESFIKPILESAEKQYQEQIANGVTDPVVDLLIGVKEKHIPFPTMSINPTDGLPSSTVIFQAPEILGVERGTSITLGIDAQRILLEKSAKISTERDVRAYDMSMEKSAQRAAQRSSDVLSSKGAAIPASDTSKAL